MTTGLKDERLQELSESNYVMLKEAYCLSQQLKGLVDRLHLSYLKQGGVQEMDMVMAIKLTSDRLYEGLERYLRPECDPDSAYDPAKAETE
ncbi:hypothetical protein KOM00_19555 [Geomonas sp. Red69]|uniref:Uncharacterized protein n=1 Tax=Geomonas diazotrophica TaxID=2843197 RepID=A0ABX8JH01_9BACT|nr:MULTISPECIES: hypothetical protein [Geomonas]MBU5638922.1 hypothetical protein [Geomonas diazotrophica]QWV96401.1 hypothetical protein KP005_13595 [Geomonas nitrogeniifigens]QXE85468.1 hypothetical protein KP003_13880 [Geomonas nitrogeniifigens]